MTELNDQSLLAHWYRHRNAEAFRVLATRHARMVYATALRILRNVHDAEEVAQQSFLALAQTRRPPSGNVAAWLHRTAFRAALNLTRARKRRTARDHAYAATKPESTRTEWDDIRGLVDEAVAGLPDACRECIVLYFFEEQTHAAIGERLGITRQAVAQRIEKGITLVRKRLASRGVVAPAGAALVALIHENTAHALPATLTTELGRIALAGTPSLWAVGATYVSGLGFNVAAAVLVVGAGWTLIQFADHGPSAAPNMMDGHIVGEAPNLGFVSATETPRSASASISTSASLEKAESDVQSATDQTGDSEASPTDQSRLASAAGIVTLPDGQPFRDAHVRLINVDVLDDYRYPEQTLFDLKADAHGRFDQPDMPPAEYSVMVTEPADNSWGAANEFMRITLTPGEQRKDLNIVFGSEGNLTVSGTVVDGEGRPLEEARVYKFGPAPRAAVTDAQGRFTLRFLPDDDIRFNPDKQGYSGLGTTVPAGTQDVQLIMYGNGAIAGRVIDVKTRKPVPQFEVSYMNGHPPAFSESLFGNGKQCDDSEGLFEIADVYVGEVTVVARAPGYAPAMAQVVVEPGSTLRDVTMELDRASAKALSGIVVSEDGTPMAGARIYTDRIAPLDDRLSNVVAETDAAGVFTVENATPDTPFFAAWYPDYAPNYSAVTEYTTIVLKHAARLNVEVLSQGKPLPRTEVRVYFLGARNIGYIAGGITDSAGRVQVAEVIPGQVVAEIQLPLGRAPHKVLDFAPGEEKSIQFHISPGEASVEGTIYNDGQPVGGGRVSLYVEAETGIELFKTPISADGTFQIQGVPTGIGQLVAETEAARQRPRVSNISLATGETTTVTVDVAPTRNITGTVAGLRSGDAARITVFYGAMEHQEVIHAALRGWLEPTYAGVGDFGGTTAYEMSLQEPGTYTLLVSTSPSDGSTDETYHDSRVVEVTADEDLVADFQLNY